jgi:hypothetical protein
MTSRDLPKTAKITQAHLLDIYENKRSRKAARSRKNDMVKSDVLDLIVANNAASKLCELAAQRDRPLTPLSGRLK